MSTFVRALATLLVVGGLLAVLAAPAAAAVPTSDRGSSRMLRVS